MMQLEFRPHAIERILGRMSSVVSYAEIQSILSAKQLRNGSNRVLVKVLDHSVVIKDPDAINGRVQGNKIFALCLVKDGGCRIDTVALSN